MMLLDFDKSLLEMRDSKKRTALHVLANMPHIFESGYVKGFWAELIYDCNNVLPSLFSTMIKKFKNYISFLFFFLNFFIIIIIFLITLQGFPWTILTILNFLNFLNLAKREILKI